MLAAVALRAEPLRACAGEPALAQLDFWLGEWEVCVAGERAGHDSVTKVLAGCAVTEEWTASDGSPVSTVAEFASRARSPCRTERVFSIAPPCARRPVAR
jgi:hypothetical protein